ncbi:MAG: helix-turn-helix domain-containing protein [Lachnospiraceae bacterium]|nr:helix-turn-helix domain-containing protein [Lachnospiraceae bacterium]
MIDYSPFWETLRKSNESWYTLTKVHHISFNTLSRIKNNKDITTRTINDFCRIFNCKVENIIKYKRSNKDQTL